MCIWWLGSGLPHKWEKSARPRNAWSGLLPKMRSSSAREEGQTDPCGKRVMQVGTKDEDEVD